MQVSIRDTFKMSDLVATASLRIQGNKEDCIQNWWSINHWEKK